ncbi:DUF4430 domain-containing protein [uncultured Eubacterium sp.]|uniref:DUF4430 domain-containing protein n=1 Tax=uncultured Eubacterium sp. TaxID=165185 RepID=UPI0025D4ED8B|nr:DUF4430 domain-containing protein [uncultured Eubacterium sp.]
MNKKICALLLSAAMCFCFTACSNNTQKKQSTAVTATTSTTVAETTTKETTAKPSTTKTQATTKATTETTTKKKKVTATKVKKKKKTDTVTCTVTVECKSILDHMDDLKEGHEEFVPDDGYIIKDYTYKAKKGYTAYDALKGACKKNDIKLTAKSTSYGIYISGINNLDEFDCGKQSGWMYSVNGIMPNTTCGNVSVDDGDSIVFTYVCTFQ